MPRYEYMCATCKRLHERQVEMAARDEQFCRDCCEQLELVPSRPAFFRPGLYGKAGGGLIK